jgi:catechol 2,3-dioxygenase-like lactoylglutathione lyase family enzyme
VHGVDGVHHMTASAWPAPESLDCYAGVPGMRLVTRRVNQDDPTRVDRAGAPADQFTIG